MPEKCYKNVSCNESIRSVNWQWACSAKSWESLPFLLDWSWLAGMSNRKCKCCNLSAHAHEVGHSSQSVSISVVYLCNNLCFNLVDTSKWHQELITFMKKPISLWYTPCQLLSIGVWAKGYLYKFSCNKYQSMSFTTASIHHLIHIDEKTHKPKNQKWVSM